MPERDQPEPEPPDKAARALSAVMGGFAGLAISKDPAGALAGAALVPYLEGLASSALSELRRDREGRATRLLAATAVASGLDLDDLAGRILATERTRLLAGMAIDAAMRTIYEAKIRTLGKALASGLLAEDDAEVDAEQLVIAAVADMEAPHFAVLELVARYWPDAGFGEFTARRYDPASPWGRREWTEQHIIRARPTVQPVLTSLLGTLQRHGLVVQADTVPKALENYADEQARRDGLAALSGTGGALSRGSAKAIPTTWAPTELGERLLTYVEQRGGEDDGAPGSP